MERDRDLILIVEDERDIASMLESWLEKSGHDVVCAHDGAQALRAAGRQPDLVLLDVGLPDMDGREVCRRLRAMLSCPIVFLTARVEDADELEGFAAGGDDYVTKPFSMATLGARVEAHLARERRHGLGEGRARAVLHVDAHLAIDFAACQATFDGVPVELARKDFEICALLAKHPGQVFDRDRIYEIVWGQPGSSGVVTEHVRRLRAALAQAGAEREYVQTVWGMGYRWAG